MYQFLKSRHYSSAALCFFMLALASLIWSLPSLINGIPLTYYDSAYYLFNAFNLQNPTSVQWRPLTYSYLIAAPLKLLGLNGLIILQNLVTAIIVYFASQSVIKVSRPLYLCAILLFIPLTSLIHYSNFIMPDIMMGLSVLCFATFLMTDNSLLKSILYLTSILFAATHITSILVLSVLFIGYLFSKKYYRSLIFICLGFFAFLSFLLFTPTNTPLKKATHLLLYSRINAYSLDDAFLKERCQSSTYQLCQYPYMEFDLWKIDSNPKIIEMGGAEEFISEVAQINRSFLSSSYIVSFFTEGFMQSLKQMILFARPMEIIITDEVLRLQFIRYFPLAIKDFDNPKIFNNQLFSLKMHQTLHQLLYFVTTLVSLLFLFIKRKALKTEHKILLVSFFIAYFTNSITVGFLSEPSSRYNNRFIWIIPLVAMLLIATTLLDKSSTKPSETL